MSLIRIRDIVSFLNNGDNSTDTVINGVHFNTTALDFWNYTLYSNNTISNGSSCYLIFGQYQPSILSNGTFINGTDCSSPILPLDTRGRLGALFGSLFGLSIVFTLVNLSKHGSSYLREDKRFTIVGRRWQWYWMLFAGACGMISCITGIDVDRDYLQGTALILQSLFFFLCGQAALGAVWEGIRHWGSWQERQLIDHDPYTLRHNDSRGKAEFYLPLVFYAFAFMSFFMTVPRSWTKVVEQGGTVQQTAIALPIATDGRFKAGGFLLAIAWLTAAYCIRHNLYYYRAGNTLKALFTDLPVRFTLSLLIIGVYVGYTAASAWIFNISIMKYDVAVKWPFVLGYAPCLLVIIILNVWGFLVQNEDQQLIRQRIHRGQRADEDLGLTRKPNWWSKATGDHHNDDLSRLQNMVATENIHNDQSTVTAEEVELKDMVTHINSTGNNLGQADNLRPRSVSRNRLNPPIHSSVLNRSPSSNNSIANSTLTSTTTLNGENPMAGGQVVRSMLDV